MQTVRIFVSSPRDVGSERALASRVIERLRFEFRGIADVEPVFWEQMPMRATDTFQAQIPLAGQSDICVFILWSWFGTPLPETYQRGDGSRYASGTEYEFENAVQSHAQRGMPDILVYRKTAELRATIQNREQVLERLAQRDAVQEFIDRYFHGEGGSFRAAFRDFEAPADFEEMLETHLRELIRTHLHADAGIGAGGAVPLWTQSPFRGLEIFDVEHALIFCGRTRAVTEILDTLRRRADLSQPLMLVTGISGSGKSSLVRAGVVQMLVQPRVVEEVVAWRRAIMRPSDGGAAGPLAALVAALLHEDALPELTVGGTTAQSLVEVLRDKPAAFGPFLALTLDRVVERARQSTPELDPAGVARLVLVVDQLEEIFVPAITPGERDAFIAAVAGLAADGQVWVLATLRADFYPRCGEFPDAFGDLIRGDGTYELRPPRTAEIAQMIRRPALIAGLSFERNPETEEGLDDALRDAAAANPGALPLLQFALDELYKRRSGNLLRFADYQTLGGLEGALRQRAEEEFGRLPPAVQAALPAVLSALVRVGLEDDAVGARRSPRAQLAGATGALDLADAFVAARLFVADRSEGEGATIGVAHEALLREWPRARDWIAANKEVLRLRARVAAAAMIWEGSSRDTARLLPPGKAVAEAATLLRDGGFGLGPVTTEFIAASQAYAAHRQRQRRQIYAAAAAVLVALLAGAGWYYDGYIDTKVRYYPNFTKKFGVFVGVGPQLTEAAAHHRGMSLKFYFAGRYGPPKRLESINGHGVCPQTSAFQTYLGQVSQDSSGVNTYCRAELSYDGGKIANEVWFDRNGMQVFTFTYSNETIAEFHSRAGVAISMSQSGASRVRFTRIESGPQRGHDRTVRYLDAYGNPEPDRDGKYGQECEYDERGQAIRLTALSEDDKPTLPRGAPATTRLRYDDRGNIVEYRFFDENGAAMRDPSSGAVVQQAEYDEYGNIVTLTLLDAGGQPAKGADKYVKETRVYNLWGDLVESVFWDRYGQPVLANGGYASVTRQFDDQGRWVEANFFAVDGSAIAAGDSSERIRAAYDRAGNLAELSFVDHDGKPVTLAVGYSRIARRYDENGYKIGESYLDQTGAPVDTTGGYAQIQISVDANGRAVDQVYLDKLGKRVAVVDGYAEQKMSYDSRGNPTGTAYFDVAGKAVVAKAGWARETKSFDDRGNVIEEAYFDAYDRPARISVGYSILRYTFDRRGNEIAHAYYAAPGQLIDKEKGCPTTNFAYDERREQIEWACRDGNGDLVISPVTHFARHTKVFDPRGNLTDEAYFDDHNEPMRDPAEGFAEARFLYDEDRNLVEAKFFDEHAQPLALPKIGCADVVLTYNQGRLTGRRCAAAPASPLTGPKG